MALYRETARTLASLHSANVDSIGLGKYGRRNDYCKRQVIISYDLKLALFYQIPTLALMDSFFILD